MSDIVIAIRGGGELKTRCASVLKADARVDLAVAMLGDMLDSLHSSRRTERVWIVTRDSYFAAYALSRGARAIFQVDDGLNAAFTFAHWKLSQISKVADVKAVAFLPGDLPLLEGTSIDRAFEAAERKTPVLVPAQTDGGTNGIVVSANETFTFHFGDRSFSKHCDAVRATGRLPQILRTPGLGFDLDRPSDLVIVQRRAPNSATARLLSRTLSQKRHRLEETVGATR